MGRAALYPAAWRARYGDELEILVEDAGPRCTDLLDIVRGALGMQVRNLNFWKIAAAFTVAGALISGARSLTLPDRYVSSAVLRVAGSPEDARRRLDAVQQFALSRQSLMGIILREGLYANERAREPLEDVVLDMRNHDLRMVRINGSEFAVSFAHDDPSIAQATVHAVVASLIEGNLQVDRRNAALTLEVLDPASLPATPAGPNRAGIVGRGVLAGLALGTLCGAVWSIVRRRERWSWKRMSAFAGAGMAMGFAVGLVMPDQYISTAVLRNARGDRLESAVDALLTESALAAIIERDDLYPRELAATPMDKIAARMRSDITIRTVRIPEAGACAITISFRYSDRYKAQLVVRDLAARFMGAMTLELLDPPSLPLAPSSPNRPQIAALGILAGLLLGLAASRFRRPPLATA